MKNKYKHLRKTFKKRRFARIKRKISNGDYYINRGYIIHLTRKFTFLQETENFCLHGIIVILNSDIKSVRYNKNDRYYDFIMKSEGQMKKLKKRAEGKFENWRNIFKSLKSLDKYVIVEMERISGKPFIIGEIAKVKSKSVYIRYFDANGEWDLDLTKINYDAITKITYDDRYIDVFRNYTKDKLI